MSTPRPRSTERRATGQPSVFRWECRCQDPPQLLATYDAAGRVNIKVRDRYWHVIGLVQTICPRCGAEHLLDLRLIGDQAAPAVAPAPALIAAERDAAGG